MCLTSPPLLTDLPVPSPQRPPGQQVSLGGEDPTAAQYGQPLPRKGQGTSN